MFALGATKWEVLTRAVIPYARSGYHRSARSRARPRDRRGDGGRDGHRQQAGNLAVAVRSRPTRWRRVSANEFTEATGQEYVSVLIGIGSMLFIVSMIVNVFARLLVCRRERAKGRRA